MEINKTSSSASVHQNPPNGAQPTTAARPSSIPSRRNSSGFPIGGLKNFLTSRQVELSDAVRSGRRVNPHAIQEANDAALNAAIAESMKPWADAMTDHQAKILGAMTAGLRVTPEAIQKANDNAIAAAIRESLKQSSPAQSHNFNSASPQQPRPPQASVESPGTSPTLRPGTPESTPTSAALATASSAASGAQAPNPTTHAQLGVPEGADWRQVFQMVGRVLPETVIGHAKTSDGIQQMIAEITKAEQDARKQYRKLLIAFHPDKHFGKDMKAVNDVIAEAYNLSEKEFASAKRWLDDQSKTVEDPTRFSTNVSMIPTRWPAAYPQQSSVNTAPA
jgi:hypothetical protein